MRARKLSATNYCTTRKMSIMRSWVVYGEAPTFMSMVPFPFFTIWRCAKMAKVFIGPSIQVRRRTMSNTFRVQTSSIQCMGGALWIEWRQQSMHCAPSMYN